MDIVRWGLLSTANINKKLIPAIRESARGELTAVASRTERRARTYARQWKIPNWFGSYRDMLESGEVDAIYLSLPNHLHAEWTIQALESGMHVLCEKPLALTLEEVDAMFTASREQELVLAEAFMYRHHPQTKLVGEWVRSGKLGQLSMVRGAFDFFLPLQQRQAKNLNVRLKPEYGGGSLWDVGVYPLSFAQYVLGKAPDRVFGLQRVGETGVDEYFAGQMIYRLPGGAEAAAQISSSFQTPYHTFFEIVGEEGRLHLNRPFTNLNRGRKLTYTTPKGKTRTLKVPRKELYLGEVEDMHAAILDGRSPYLKPEESRDHIRTVLALYRSACTGAVVELNA